MRNGDRVVERVLPGQRLALQPRALQANDNVAYLVEGNEVRHFLTKGRVLDQAIGNVCSAPPIFDDSGDLELVTQVLQVMLPVQPCTLERHNPTLQARVDAR